MDEKWKRDEPADYYGTNDESLQSAFLPPTFVVKIKIPIKN